MSKSFECLFSKNLTQKHKIWHDGKFQVDLNTKRAKLFSDEGHVMEVDYLNIDSSKFSEGELHRLGRYLIELSSFLEEEEPRLVVNGSVYYPNPVSPPKRLTPVVPRGMPLERLLSIPVKRPAAEPAAEPALEFETDEDELTTPQHKHSIPLHSQHRKPSYQPNSSTRNAFNHDSPDFFNLNDENDGDAPVDPSSSTINTATHVHSFREGMEPVSHSTSTQYTSSPVKSILSHLNDLDSGIGQAGSQPSTNPNPNFIPDPDFLHDHMNNEAHGAQLSQRINQESLNSDDDGSGLFVISEQPATSKLVFDGVPENCPETGPWTKEAYFLFNRKPSPAQIKKEVV